MLGGLALLPGWWSTAAATGYPPAYPPALSCAVSGFAPAGAGLLLLHGTGFGVGARVLVGLGGSDAGAVRADAAGSFVASWPAGALAADALVAGATVTAADAGCSATGTLAIEIMPASTGNTSPPPGPSGSGPSGSGPSAGAPGPARPGKPSPPATRPSPFGPSASGARPEPAPPARRADPPQAAIPSIPVAGLQPQLFLGLAGAVLLAGVGLTGLAGRLGHRAQHPALPDTLVAAIRPTTPDAA
jgi:hypothetical protein